MPIVVLRGSYSPCKIAEHVSDRDDPLPQSGLWDSCPANLHWGKSWKLGPASSLAIFLTIPCTGFQIPPEFLAHIKRGETKEAK